MVDQYVGTPPAFDLVYQLRLASSKSEIKWAWEKVLTSIFDPTEGYTINMYPIEGVENMIAVETPYYIGDKGKTILLMSCQESHLLMGNESNEYTERKQELIQDLGDLWKQGRAERDIWGALVFGDWIYYFEYTDALKEVSTRRRLDWNLVKKPSMIEEMFTDIKLHDQGLLENVKNSIFLQMEDPKYL